MGNLCGRQSSRDDYFASPGRTLGSAHSGVAGSGQGTRRSTIPKTGAGGTYVYGQGQGQRQSQKQGHEQGGQQSSQGRTVGAGSASAGGESSPRQAAARAAEERAKRNQGEGKLGKQLEAQKRQTVNATLEQVSKENRAARDADAAAEARQWR